MQVRLWLAGKCSVGGSQGGKDSRLPVATTVYDIDSPGTVSINLPTLTLSAGLGKGRERLTASAGTPGSRKAAAARC